MVADKGGKVRISLFSHYVANAPQLIFSLAHESSRDIQIVNLEVFSYWKGFVIFQHTRPLHQLQRLE